MPRLRFHLSTALILTFVAGLLLWANLRTASIDPESELFTAYVNSWLPVNFATRGWPMPACVYFAHGINGALEVYYIQRSIAIDAVVALAVLFATTLACELLPGRLTRLFERAKNAKMGFLRFHLSTALILTVAAGAFLGLNLRPAHEEKEFQYVVGIKPSQETEELIPAIRGAAEHIVVHRIPAVHETRVRRDLWWNYGWPIVAIRKVTTLSEGSVVDPFIEPAAPWWDVNWGKIALNVAIAIGALSGLFAMCEWVAPRLTRHFKRGE